MKNAPIPGALVPNAEYIRKRVPIVHIAQKLGLKGDGNRFDCWKLYKENLCPHNRRRTVSVHLKSNTLRCFACEPKESLGPIDLVKSVRECTVREAIAWIDANFEGIPKIRLLAGKMKSSETWPTFSLEEFIRSRAWSDLSHVAGKIAARLLVEVPPSGDGSRIVRLTFPTITRWCGVKDKRAIHGGLAELQSIGFLSWGAESIEGNWMERGPRHRTVLVLSWDSAAFRAWISGEETHQLPGMEPHQSGAKMHRITKSHGGVGVESASASEHMRQSAKSCMVEHRPDWEAERRAVLQQQAKEILAREAAGEFVPREPESTPELVPVGVAADPPAEANATPCVRRMRSAGITTDRLTGF